MRGLLGIGVILSLAWALSEERGRVPWRLVIAGILLQFGLALLFLKFPPARAAFLLLNRAVEGLQSATEAGTGRFCQGDSVSHADLCLVSLWVGTGIFGIDTAAYPTVARIAEACLALPAVAEAHPLRQPGAPGV